MSIGLALLVSADPVTIQQFSRTLRQLSIAPDICRDVTTASRLLNRRKFDAVVVDLQLGECIGPLLDEVRRSSSNRSAVTFVITADAEATAAFSKKVSFVFERPLTAQSIRNTLKLAYGLILRERRRYFRCPVATPVVIARRNQPELRCHSVNISEGGMALSTFVPLTPGESVRVEFGLPDHAAQFDAEATVCWCQTGHLGIRFVSLSQQQKAELKSWLSRKFEEMLPGFVAREFQKAESALSPSIPTRHRSRVLGQNSSDREVQPPVADEAAKSALRIHTRRWKRCQLDVPLRVIVRNEDTTKIYDGRGNEISEGGMTITAGVELKLGDGVAVEFTPPYAGAPIRVRGVVRNRTGYRYGVEFTIENSEDSGQVNRLRPMLQTLENE